MGPLMWGAALANLAFQGIDTFRRQQQADQQNELAGQGRQRLGSLGSQMFNAGTREANRLGTALQQNAFNRYASGANELDRLRNEQRSNASSTANEGAVQFAREAGGRYMQDMRNQEQARRASFEGGLDAFKKETLAEYGALKEMLGEGFRDVADRTQAVLDLVVNRSDTALDEMRGLRGEALGALLLDAARAVASVQPAIGASMQQAIGALNQKYASKDLSKTDVQAMYQREKAQIEKVHREETLNIVANTESQLSQIRQQTHAAFGESIAGLHASSLSTIGSTGSAGAATLASAYNTHTNGLDAVYSTTQQTLTGIEGMRGQSMALESQLLGGARGSVFDAEARGYAQNRAMNLQLYDAFSQLEDQYYTDRAYSEVTYSNLINSAWANYGNMEVAAAQSLINSSFEFVPWSTPFGNLTSTLMDMESLGLQERSVAAQETAARWSFMPDSVNVGFNMGNA